MTINQENEHLENIKELLAYDIPEFTPPDDGFLEIIGLSHYENVNSKIYAYFLNQRNEPKISNLFISSLLNLIDEKNKSEIGKELNIKDFTAITEIQTNEGHRIDILIEDKNNESAIIIENKIYHSPDNPLNDYWNFINYNENKKVGILLTLQPLSSSELKNIKTVKKSTLIDNFINITHKEWIDKIINAGLPTGLSPKMYIYLNDFFQTIDNLTKSTTMNELTKFYFQYPKKINSAVETLKEAEKFINTQLEILAENLNSSIRGKTYEWRHIVKHPNETIYYAIVFDSLFKGGKEITVIIELSGKDYDKKEDVKKHLEKDEENKEGININAHIKEKGLILVTSVGDAKYRYCHLVSGKYQLDLDKIENLAGKLKTIIDDDFSIIMTEINNFLYPKP